MVNMQGEGCCLLWSSDLIKKHFQKSLQRAKGAQISVQLEAKAMIPCLLYLEEPEDKVSCKMWFKRL